MSATINQSTLRRAEPAPRYAFGMDKYKYESKQAKRSGFKLHEFRQFLEVIPCDCGDKKCKGWQVRFKYRAERRREGNA